MNDGPRDWVCPEALIAYTLGGTIVMWLPSFLGLIHGSVEFSTAMFRLAIALVVATVAVRVVGRMVDNYLATNHRMEVASMLDRHRKQMSERQQRSRMAAESALDREMETDEP
ncbi:MAG: hypothetical protein ACOYNI_00745 [Acidimicrobiia bacterium]